jgi:hypothetical protein
MFWLLLHSTISRSFWIERVIFTYLFFFKA